MIFSMTLLLWCLGATFVWLVVSTWLLELLARRLRIFASVPSDLREDSRGAVVMQLMMESLFFVVIPSVGYTFFYLVLPFSGIRAGVAAALFAALLGAVPVAMSLSTRIRVPLSVVLWMAFTHLVKLTGSLAIISYLYTL